MVSHHDLSKPVHTIENLSAAPTNAERNRVKPVTCKVSTDSSNSINDPKVMIICNVNIIDMKTNKQISQQK